MNFKKIKSRFLKYGFIRSFLIFFRKTFMKPLGFLSLYNKFHIYNENKFKKGTKKWLISKELKYGGRISTETNNGGDRMSFWWHNYSPYYEKFISKFIDKKDIVLIEVGIFKGTGVAIWSDLFPNTRIIGLDINLKNIEENMDFLQNKGAFKNNNLELYEFDQYKNNKEKISKILKGDKVNIVIDDRDHSNESIINTLNNFLPFLSDKFVYFIEDNKNIGEIIKRKYPNYKINSYGELTIISNL